MTLILHRDGGGALVATAAASAKSGLAPLIADLRRLQVFRHVEHESYSAFVIAAFTDMEIIAPRLRPI